MIHILDDATVDKIAAGEVVERPASVVKELVENSIDAKAGKIEVEIMAGGTSFIRVTDNGIGMDSKNARLSILRHATSKLEQVDDLMKIATLGFRGEALPSIAAVSRFELLTRRHSDDFGTKIKITGGTIDEIDEAGCAVGTTIKVEDLFFNVPARKKFLKTTVTEASKINNFIVKLALSRPDIAFKFISNGKLAAATPGNGSLYDAIECLYGAKVSEAMLPIELVDEDIKITGFITKPAVIRSSRAWQALLINGRTVTSRIIYKAVDNAYHSLLPRSGYPFLIMNIELDKREVDINVHPQKAEVKFADEQRLFKAVFAAVSQAIKPPDDHRSLSDFAVPLKNRAVDKAAHTPQQMQQEHLPLRPRSLPGGYSSAGESAYSLDNFREVQRLLNGSQRGSEVRETAELPACTATESPPPAVPSPSDEKEIDIISDRRFSEAADLRPIGQIDTCFIVAQGPDGGMYLVDQHAAHERILYDRFSRQAERMPVQPLLVHLLLDVSSEEMELIRANQDLFYQLGFDAEPAGEEQVRLREVPADIKEQDAESAFCKILSSLQDLHRPTPQEIRHACLAMTACKAAVKAGDVLTIQQMKIILAELGRTQLPYTCPHGRPTIVKFSSYDLNKMFKRVK